MNSNPQVNSACDRNTYTALRSISAIDMCCLIRIHLLALAKALASLTNILGYNDEIRITNVTKREMF